MADRHIIIEDDKGNRYFPYTKVELVEGAETPSGAQAKADTAEANAKSYTDQQVATKADVGHKHSASDITSGTIAAARLPSASTSARGIVQLTTSRTSTSNTLALAASAMNAHRTSSDHDDRYYTKEQVDSLVSSAGMEWVVPGIDTLEWVWPREGSAWETGSDWEAVASFTVTLPGRYQIYGTMRARSDDSSGFVAVCVPGWTARELMPGNVTLSDLPPRGLGWASPIFETWNRDSDVSFTLDMLVPTPPGGAIIVVARNSSVSYISLNGSIGQPPPTRAWSRKN